jgi:hypothetical protein
LARRGAGKAGEEEAQRPILERVAHTGPIHNTLTHPPKIEMMMGYGE